MAWVCASVLESKTTTNTKFPGGIGSATGRALLARGANLALLYAPFESSKRDQLLESGYGPSSSSSSSSSKIQTFECDITSPTSITSTFESVQQHVDNPGSNSRIFPSILANCAGYVSLSKMEDTPPEETQLHLNNNILGPMLVSQAFARMYFRARDGATEANAQSASSPAAIPPGRIVSISSQAAHVALDKHGAYCASKAGLVGLTKCMASEWGGRGITANTVSPGVVWT